ncbi:putative ATPase associated with various cellular activities AAA_5 [uncultured Desulfobacterium sp.]|uniref:Putative ATPase associated with various cellular activities AAA_5 n=1 Tax=uncultured Desulfobacterium sp. TaxID=201089 RepID=A0A445MQW2_9BACT|nr:putative ATPase associated with various cellular activities AAA_5 [uncultured Desulfobacterium sp.]
MYLEYWGLKSFPFDNIPDPDIFYMSSPHVEGLTRLLYAARNKKALSMLTGDVGSGKTALMKVFINKLLSEDSYDIAQISNPCHDSTEFLRDILYKLGMTEVPAKRFEIIRALEQMLTAKARSGKDIVIIVDEAQLLSPAALEEVRLLQNFNASAMPFISIFLLGQPGLLDNIKRQRQVCQRVSVSYFLRPLDLNDTARYIFFRQRKAGLKSNVFTRQAIEMIYRHSRGLAGVINNLCDMAFLVGFGEKKKAINLAIIKDVIQDGAI